MRYIIFLLFIPLLTIPLLIAGEVIAGEVSSRDQLRDFLSGASHSYPQATTPAEREEQRLAIRSELHNGGANKEDLWGLLFNLGPCAAPLWPEMRTAILSLPLSMRKFASGEAIAALGPIAEDLLPEAIADPEHLGLTWPQLIQIAADPSVLMSALRHDLSGDNPMLVNDAAQSLQHITWSPSSRTAIPELVAALSRWNALPKLGTENVMAANGMFERDDPDHENNMHWRVHGDTVDPWPAILIALAKIDPTSDIIKTAVVENIKNDMLAAYRRRAALESCRYLTEIIAASEMTHLLSPWLGPVPRGRLALVALGQTGPAAIPILTALPKEKWLPIAEEIENRIPWEWNTPLPESWAPELVNVANSRERWQTNLLPWCGAAGLETALQASDDILEDVRLVFVGTRVPPPDRAPVELMEALGCTNEKRRQLAAYALEAWYFAPWFSELVPALMTLPVNARKANRGDFLHLRVLVGDERVIAWTKK